MATGSFTIWTSVGFVTGVVASVVPAPIWPWLLLPQQRIAPALMAQVCPRPVAIAVTFASPGTATGCARLVVVPSPSWLLALLPQQLTDPSVRSAQACCQCAASARTSASPCTGVGGRGAADGAPSPISPSLSSPQQVTVRSASSAQVNPAPAANAVALSIPGTATGAS